MKDKNPWKAPGRDVNDSATESSYRGSSIIIHAVKVITFVLLLYIIIFM